MNYFEFNEHRTQRGVAFDVIDWPPIVVTESELPEPEIPLIEDGE